jgi:hypothetical protein
LIGIGLVGLLGRRSFCSRSVVGELALQRHIRTLTHHGVPELGRILIDRRQCPMRIRFVIVAAVLSLAVSAGLVIRVLAIDKPAVLVILVPAVLGAILALWRSEGRAVVGLACAMTFVTAVVSLIGGVGLLYVPSIALFLVAIVTARSGTSHPQTTSPTEAGVRPSGDIPEPCGTTG